MIGNSYILKLIHYVEDKLNARALGPYSSVVEQPTRGKAKSGGQKFGEMEAWALEAYGCSINLQEFFSAKSDDIFERVNYYNAKASLKPLKYKYKSFFPTSFLVLLKELNSLGFDFSFYNINNDFQRSSDIKLEKIKPYKILEFRLKFNELRAIHEYGK
jgi:DNA-directed RNA polymerase subunit beta